MFSGTVFQKACRFFIQVSHVRGDKEFREFKTYVCQHRILKKLKMQGWQVIARLFVTLASPKLFGTRKYSNKFGISLVFS